MPRIADLALTEYNPYYANYIKYVGELSLRSALDESAAELLEFLNHVEEERTGFAYAPGKWTVAQCLQHVIDTERIFSYRALCIARGDKTPLPGFEQNDYAEIASVSERRFLDMVKEFRVVRKGTIALFNSLTDNDIVRTGTMSGGGVSVRALGFIISGHVYHHAKVYREKYGK